MTTITSNTIQSPEPNLDAPVSHDTSTAKLDDQGLLIKDPKKALELHITSLQNTISSLKNRNIKGEQRKILEVKFKDSITSYIDIVAACINNNIVDSDKTGILQGNANKKYFKDYVGHINKIAKQHLLDKSKISATKDALISDTELAKLIETPYTLEETETPLSKETPIDDSVYDDKGITYVEATDVPEVDGVSVIELECTDGSKVTVDKENNTLYTEVTDNQGETITLKRKILNIAHTWYETAKNIAISIFGLVWSSIKTVSAFGSVLVGGAVGTVTASVAVLGTGLFQGFSKFKSDLTKAHKRAKFKVGSA